jgi:hypothetical protein
VAARRLLLWTFVLACVWAGTSTDTANAQDVPSRRMGVRWEDDVPHVSFSARDLVNADVRRKLESGLPQTIEMTIFAYAKGRARPITIVPRACRITYDLWEEVYRVQLKTAQEDRSERVGSLDAVLKRCLVADEEGLGKGKKFTKHQRVYFAVLVEFNPLSSDTVQKIRRWLARPSGGGFEGDAFFGSFVSLFVNRRIGDAERTMRFRSQTVEVP